MQAQTFATENMILNNVGLVVPFDISSSGVRQPVRWGVDTAWRWSWWPLRATNHMRECVSLGRVTLDPRWSGQYTALSEAQQNGLDEQLDWLKKSGVKDLYMIAGNTSGTAWQISYRTPYINDLALAVTYLREKGYNVLGISPFNEPDYGVNRAPNATEMAEVARLMRQNSTLANVDVMGPSTLNPDYTISWWNTMADAVQIINTHQLAGSFDNFREVYARAERTNKRSAGDEMHNTGDALIGMNHGMEIGIWWSDYGGYTRAELGRACNDGVRIGYAESGVTFTATGVWRRDGIDFAEIFMGSSERQAAAQNYNFVSQDRLAYFDGQGPFYDYASGTPGGTGYSAGQTNAESTIEVTYGEDVPAGAPQGHFYIVNKATGKLLTVASATSNTAVTQSNYGSTKQQEWVIMPQLPGWDFAYSFVRAAKNTDLYLDGQKYGGDNGASVQIYEGNGNECERWHFRYMGNGYYVITNHDSGLSLEGSYNNTSNSTTGVSQWERTGSDRQLWRLVPAGAKIESVAPAVPAGLVAQAASASVKLSWEANTEDDLLGYMVYRYNDNAEQWETLARCVPTSSFVDNTCPKQGSIRYRIRAIDKSWNMSEPSAEVSVELVAGGRLLACYPLGFDTDDITENHHNAVSTPLDYDLQTRHAFATFDGSDYIKLPYRLADTDEFTFAAWVKPTSTSVWQRIFDFGSSMDNYMMLTTSNGSVMRFEICQNGVKKGLNATKTIANNTWTHVTVTLGKNGARIYFNGTLNAKDESLTISPSSIRPLLGYLGRSMFDGDALFQGSMCDARFYDYTLSADEVKSLRNYDLLDLAASVLKQPMYHGAREALQAVVIETEQAINEGTSITTSLTKLSKQIALARQSVEAYHALSETFAWSASIVEENVQKDAEALPLYEDGLAVLRQNYETGVFADDEIEQAVTDVETVTQRYLMTDLSQSSSSVSREITHILRNSDFTEGTSRWMLSTNDDYKGACNYDCFEIFNHSFNLSRTLYGMPAGTYKLSVQAFYRNGEKINAGSTEVNAYLYIDDQTKTIMPISSGANNYNGTGDWYAYETRKTVPNDMLAASVAFNVQNRYKPTSLNNTVSAEHADASQPLVFGLRKDVEVTNDWTVINYAKLYYKPAASTGIDEVGDATQLSSEMYDLQGRRLQRIDRPGLYIVGGKKMLVK